MSKIGYYPVQDKWGIHKLPGVTTILDTLGFHSSLTDWAIKEGTTKLLQELRLAKKEGRKILKDEAVKIAQSARQDILKQAQRKGLYIHQAVQDTLEGKTPAVEVEFAGWFDSFLAWQTEHEFNPIFQEQFVYDLDEEYAGRLDYYGMFDGQLSLLDFKTSNHPHNEYGIQLAAYRNALEKLGYPVERMFVVYIKPNGCELVEHHETFDLFQAVNKIFKWRRETNSAYDEWYKRMPDEQIKEQMNRLKRKKVENIKLA